MDRACHRAIFKAKEDRISNLPDEIIHHIMSFLDMKDSIRTSKLSRRWRKMWTIMPHLNFNSYWFLMLPQFAKFVKYVLSRRNNGTHVSTVALTFTGAATHFVVKNILKYAYSHNLQQLKILWLSSQSHQFNQYIFSSHTLKHLTLIYGNSYTGSSPYLPNLTWDFPVLETLKLRKICMGNGSDKNLNLFSKCVNLKDITLDECFGYNLEVFNVCAPQLSDLTITSHESFAKVIKVVAPRLENLKLYVGTTSCFKFVDFSEEGFGSLKKVNLSLSLIYEKTRHVPVLLDLFQQLRSVRFLVLDVEIIETLSSCLDQLSHEPCPFNNLMCLKINTMHKARIEPMPLQIRKYFLDNSPSATLIMNLPQPTPVHRTTTGACCLCPSYNNRHLLPPRIQLSVTPVRRAPSPVGSPFVRISNIHHTAGVQSSFRPPVQRQLSPRPPPPPPPPPSGPQKRVSCPIHNGAPAKKVAKLEVEEKRMLGAKSQMHELLEALRREKEALWHF